MCDFINNWWSICNGCYMMRMGEKPQNIQKTNTKTKEKIPRLVALPSTKWRPTFFRCPKTPKTSRTYSRWERELKADNMILYTNFHDLQQKQAGVRYKNNGDEEDLGDLQLGDGDDDSQHTATRFLGFKGENQCLLTRDGVPKDPYRRRHGPAEEGRMTPTLPPFVGPGSLHSPTFCRML